MHVEETSGDSSIVRRPLEIDWTRQARLQPTQNLSSLRVGLDLQGLFDSNAVQLFRNFLIDVQEKRTLMLRQIGMNWDMPSLKLSALPATGFASRSSTPLPEDILRVQLAHYMRQVLDDRKLSYSFEIIPSLQKSQSALEACALQSSRFVYLFPFSSSRSNLNRESSQSLLYTVRTVAQLRTKPGEYPDWIRANMATSSLRLLLDDVDDSDTDLIVANASVVLPSSVEPLTNFASLSAKDADTSDFNRIAFAIAAPEGARAALFSVSPLTGLVSTAGPLRISDLLQLSNSTDTAPAVTPLADGSVNVTLQVTALIVPTLRSLLSSPSPAPRSRAAPVKSLSVLVRPAPAQPLALGVLDSALVNEHLGVIYAHLREPSRKLDGALVVACLRIYSRDADHPITSRSPDDWRSVEVFDLYPADLHRYLKGVGRSFQKRQGADGADMCVELPTGNQELTTFSIAPLEHPAALDAELELFERESADWTSDADRRCRLSPSLWRLCLDLRVAPPRPGFPEGRFLLALPLTYSRLTTLPASTAPNCVFFERPIYTVVMNETPAEGFSRETLLLSPRVVVASRCAERQFEKARFELVPLHVNGARDSAIYANASTGRVLVRSGRALDAELAPTLHYLLVYIAKDNVTGEQRRCFARLVIHLLPVDESAPQFDASLPDPLPVRVSSDLPAHAIVTQLGPIGHRDRNVRGSLGVLSGPPVVDEFSSLQFRLEDARSSAASSSSSCAQLFYVEASARLRTGLVRLQQHAWNAMNLFSTDLTRPEPTIECVISVSAASSHSAQGPGRFGQRESSIRVSFELVLQYRNTAPPEFLHPERSDKCDLSFSTGGGSGSDSGSGGGGGSAASASSSGAQSPLQDTCVFRMRAYENEPAGTVVGDVGARDPDSVAYLLHLLPAVDALDVAATCGVDSDLPASASASAPASLSDSLSLSGSAPDNATGRVRVADSAFRQLLSGSGSGSSSPQLPASSSPNAPLVPLFPHGVRYSIRGGSSLLSFSIDQRGVPLHCTCALLLVEYCTARPLPFLKKTHSLHLFQSSSE